MDNLPEALIAIALTRTGFFKPGGSSLALIESYRTPTQPGAMCTHVSTKADFVLPCRALVYDETARKLAYIHPVSAARRPDAQVISASMRMPVLRRLPWMSSSPLPCSISISSRSSW